ncbi:DUF1496 domain-containing protein [Affinibrenneria salicis]|uniref:DUF1496 domain-containing protein n=1 Tax=Affinibrenneria salicis TaxID=2590031 RepID=A0A5J5G5S3_9GAMM|nr:DUF1496 domain-containing protein [Affinibrenneria salicis]KAA9001806.1 DUF1496 domain-containing protein [Affinibrenneria salicis]
MKQLVAFVISCSALLAPALAQANRSGVEVVVPLPAEAWQRDTQNSGNDCLRCCVYQNKKYSEGAVLTLDGVVLQCARDKQTVGTNNLIWQVLKQ